MCLSVLHAVGGLLVVGSVVAQPAQASSVGKDWDRGCSERQEQWKRGCRDAQVGSNDRSKHSQEYEDGWQACKNN
jgi:hypothetical protein